MTLAAFRSAVFHCLGDPGAESDPSAREYFEDGLLLVEDGRVVAAGDAQSLLGTLPPATAVQHFPGKVILPGFIDCHVHFPQIDIVGACGAQLLDWLNRYAYPAEMRYADPDHARRAAGVFVDELLANGTTTALVFATVHEHSVDAIFEAAEARNMRLVAGKVLMDRNCPEALSDGPDAGYAASRALIERWHGRGRLGYAITPRFALTSSDAQLEAAGRLAAEFPDAWIHTHLAENRDEVDEVAQRFRWSDGYLDVYDHFGLLRPRAVFAHCLYPGDGDRERLAAKRGGVAHCPSSNLFLGSGLFDLEAMRAAGVAVGLGSDVGGGTSLSALRTMLDAYKVLQLGGQSLPPDRAIWLATLGAAVALGLDGVLGNFEPGKEADFVVLDPGATPLSRYRLEGVESIDERLFATIVLGDDRHVESTWICGRRAGG